MDQNRRLFDGMVLFCSVVEQQSLSAAARMLGHTPSHVSKEISRLETRLGARLLNRTTRRISLTEAGQIYYDNAHRIVEDAQAVEDRLMSLGDRPFGELRMSVPVVFAHGCLNDWLPEFLDRHPDVTLNLDVSERHADMVGEGIDLLVRIGALPPSDLIARELFKSRGVTVAAPEYLKRKGSPRHPIDLAEHELIDFSLHRRTQGWAYVMPDGSEMSVPIAPRICCNDAQTEKALVLAGQGIARLPLIACETEIREGRLTVLMADHEQPPLGVHAVYPSRANLPAKTRAMINFLVEKTRGKASD